MKNTPIKKLLINQVIPVCDSTNTLAKKMAQQGAPHGSWISSEIQLQGRGKTGVYWESQKGNLFLSLILRIPVEHFHTICFYTAVCIAQFLRLKGLPAIVKWPNDIYVHEKKIAGILCESTIGHHSFIIVGVGLNCHSHPENATSLSKAMQTPIAADNIRTPLREFLQKKLSSASPPFQIPLEDPVLEWIQPGIPLQWIEAKTHQLFQGKILKLSPSYELMVKKDQDEMIILNLENAYQIRIAKKS